MGIEFDGTTEPTGLQIYDPIEQRQLFVRTPSAVSPRPESTDRFPFPVDEACTLETASVTFEQRYSVNLHDEAGQIVGSLNTSDRASIDESIRFIGLDGSIKVYCRIETTGSIEVGIDSIRISFDRPTSVVFGGRSLHERPAGTIRTPDDPESMMRAVSALSSALKSTTAERSWPTLRGHPPLIERGDRLEIPSSIETPDTDVTIEIPPEYGSLYCVAPLAFYLGAAVRPGPAPLLSTPTFEYPLDEQGLLEDDVARALKRTFLMDCLVRTEGLYQNVLDERVQLESKLPFDLAETYDLPLASQLERYFEVSYDVIEDYVPRWPLTAHVPAEREYVELLPFIVNELGVVREPRGTVSMATVPSADPQEQLVRSADPGGTAPVRGSSPDDEVRFVEPEFADESIEHAWFGDHVPRRASKATIEAFRSQLDRDSRSESIEILLVCNDARMLEEHDILDEAYGDREDLPYGIHSEFGIDTDRLASLLTSGTFDFFHYIGHATESGLRCTDGELDVRTLPSVDVNVFFLNACRSYEQGLALTRRGAFGGVGTLGDVINEHAVAVGETMARLLNLGFPLRAALELAKESSVLGEQYLIVGDGSADIAQSDGGAPSIVELERQADDEFDFTLRSYSTREFRLGSVSVPNLESTDIQCLTPGRSPTIRVSREEIENYLTWIHSPVWIDGQLIWNKGIGPLTID